MDKNQAVITTKYVINGSKIVYVFHSQEGWQFFGNENNIEEGDSFVTSLDNIIKSNPHVADILWISEGMEAWINEGKTEWQTGVAADSAQ
jgi:hypothetical protein